MAGREYKARDKAVQKMSRDGLVEENLRTGKSHRVSTGRIDAVRIGDRPMENLEDGAHLSDQRIQKARESSFREAPSSLDGNTRAAGFWEAPGPEPEETPGESSRTSDRLQQDTYRTALRRGRGADPNTYDSRGGLDGRHSTGDVREGYEKDVRRHRRNQYTYRRQEGEGATGMGHIRRVIPGMRQRRPRPLLLRRPSIASRSVAIHIRRPGRRLFMPTASGRTGQKTAVICLERRQRREAPGSVRHLRNLMVWTVSGRKSGQNVRRNG